MYRTIPIRAKFNDEESAFWQYQCSHANNLINCAIFQARQAHYSRLAEMENSTTTYWVGDEFRCGWKTYRCQTSYTELCNILKDNPHYKVMAAQSAQQSLKSVAESITSYNGLVDLYYQGKVDRPSLPKYRKKGGLAAVTFPRQALTYCDDGTFKPAISRETKPELISEIKLELPDFIDDSWVREVTVRPCLGEFWIDWVIDDGKEPVEHNPNLDYSQAWGFDHGGANWLTGVSTQGLSLIIDGRKLRSMNQGYSRLVAKYKQGNDKYWDANLDRIQRKRNNQMRDAINKAARFIVNRCLNDGIGNLVIGWNEGQKLGSEMSRQNNQNFVPIPTGRLIERLKQLCPEYGIILTVTEESYTSKASFLDDDFLPKYGEKPQQWKPSGERVKRGLYKTASCHLLNSDANGAANILRKVATQLALNLTKVGRGSLTLPQRYDLFNDMTRSYRERCLKTTA